jgi:CheY-like chemotaxis protein
LCTTVRDLRQFWEEVMMGFVEQMAAGATNEKRGVLIVDDSEDLLNVFSTAIEIANLEVRTARNGLEALISAHMWLPSVVLMDLAMPVLDGIGATRLLKASEATRGIPVIAHTATPDLCRVVAKERLFAHVLPKPAPVLVGLL